MRAVDVAVNMAQGSATFHDGYKNDNYWQMAAGVFGVGMNAAHIGRMTQSPRLAGIGTRLSGVPFLDAPAQGTKSWVGFQRRLANAGIDAVPVNGLLKSEGNFASFARNSRTGKTVFEFDPAEFRVSTLIHENRHLSQILKGRKLGIDVLRSKHTRRAAEVDAYNLSIRVAERYGASAANIQALRDIRLDNWKKVRNKIQRSQKMKSLVHELVGYDLNSHIP
jgi:hypothetical protein